MSAQPQHLAAISFYHRSPRGFTSSLAIDQTLFLLVAIELDSRIRNAKMAYPEDVGIKAMEIYVPNQVSNTHRQPRPDYISRW